MNFLEITKSPLLVISYLCLIIFKYFDRTNVPKKTTGQKFPF